MQMRARTADINIRRFSSVPRPVGNFQLSGADRRTIKHIQPPRHRQLFVNPPFATLATNHRLRLLLIVRIVNAVGYRGPVIHQPGAVADLHFRLRLTLRTNHQPIGAERTAINQ
ncbi:hypothetical protein [Serratia rubidaea]|uniref:hypothetical protein n=1 Tax=Serratia rubidaea TaxID=61652 RepID=UPI002F969C37